MTLLSSSQAAYMTSELMVSEVQVFLCETKLTCVPSLAECSC